MSRIGDAPIIVPSGVEIVIEPNSVVVKGPKGELMTEIRSEIKVELSDGVINVKRKKEDKTHKSLHGLYRSKINNMVKGVTEGWTKNLEMIGVGYRAQSGGDTITLSVGFSHPVVIKAPEGISFNVADNTKISVSGIDKILVGQIAANIRDVRPPEVYKGKGIRYSGEMVKRKAGKAGKGAVGGAK
jgi:large subunit ribosomal protein L6